MTVEGLGTPSTVKKAKAEAPGKEVPRALPAGKPVPRKKSGKVMGRTARSTRPRATTSMNVIKLSSLSRDREQSMRSVIRKIVRMLLAVRAEAVKQISPTNPFGTKENPPGAKRRRPVMMLVMEGMRRKLVSRNFRRPLMPYALMEVHLCTPPTANSSDGLGKSMSWNQRRRPGSRSNGVVGPSSST